MRSLENAFGRRGVTRLGEPADIAWVVVFLCSEESHRM
jgi:NAD(P)-dependent dehydrogenase (short-subunit alcohol dehydrogenase family)